MPRLYTLLPLALATLSTTALIAQSDPAGQTSPQTMQGAPAPIERHAPTPDQYERQHGLQRGPMANYDAHLAPGGVIATSGGTANAVPLAGVYLRVAQDSTVREVASDAKHTEFRVERGVANISVHGPNDGMLLLVDLPNGQVQMLKNGLYTFNATTNTMRVLKGEANAFATSAPADTKPVKVKEDHAVTFAATAGKLRSNEFYPMEARADLIAQPYHDREQVGGGGYTGGGYYGAGEGFYGGYGYPYGGPVGYWGDPWAFGYPFGLGVGFGYGFGGGFYGGGFGGGGFHGRR
jgi:hypothetical protein